MSLLCRVCARKVKHPETLWSNGSHPVQNNIQSLDVQCEYARCHNPAGRRILPSDLKIGSKQAYSAVTHYRLHPACYSMFHKKATYRRHRLNIRQHGRKCKVCSHTFWTLHRFQEISLCYKCHKKKAASRRAALAASIREFRLRVDDTFECTVCEETVQCSSRGFSRVLCCKRCIAIAKTIRWHNRRNRAFRRLESRSQQLVVPIRSVELSLVRSELERRLQFGNFTTRSLIWRHLIADRDRIQSFYQLDGWLPLESPSSARLHVRSSLHSNEQPYSQMIRRTYPSHLSAG